MLERKRLAKQYQIVPGDEEHDLELGESIAAQDSGVVSSEIAPIASSLEAEVDNWDENTEDPWEEEEHATGTDSAEGEGPKTPSASSAGEAELPPDLNKRVN